MFRCCFKKKKKEAVCFVLLALFGHGHPAFQPQQRPDAALELLFLAEGCVLSLSVETGKTASIRHWPVTGPGTASVEKGHEKQVQLLLSLLLFMQHMKKVFLQEQQITKSNIQAVYLIDLSGDFEFFLVSF